MGRTIPSFRIASEIEEGKWIRFRSAPDKKDRKMFDEMFSYCITQLDNLSFVIACRSIIFSQSFLFLLYAFR